MTADLDADLDIRTDAHGDAAYKWVIACDGRGAVVELGVSIHPGRMPPSMPRPTPRALHDLADRLAQIADAPHWWMPIDETP